MTYFTFVEMSQMASYFYTIPMLKIKEVASNLLATWITPIELLPY